ncbi:hypothetical protein Q7P35_005090 [Cladosporium inversicolor]
MRLSSFALTFAATAKAASAAQLLICSDSTTANYALNDTLQGWGYYLNNYTTLTVTNLAKNGRSTRSFINEGLWSTLLSATRAGDYVLIEMGHNDDVDPTTDVKDRGTLPGIGDETVTVLTQKGVNETVHTFGWYLNKMISDVKAKKATPILSGMVPRNYWTGNTLQSDWAFADYAREVAEARKVEYIDHTAYSVALFQSFGPTKAKTYFPNDNTHTNPAGAVLNTQTFVQAVKCQCGGKSKLAKYLNKAAKAIKTPECQPC